MLNTRLTFVRMLFVFFNNGRLPMQVVRPRANNTQTLEIVWIIPPNEKLICNNDAFFHNSKMDIQSCLSDNE